jgi:erythromycin esterase-like protein
MRDTEVDLVRQSAVILRPETFAGAVLDVVGDADLVLIGTATHGSHEFVRLRAELTRTLIESHGFNVVAIDADWPDVERLNRWVRLTGDDLTAQDALGGFDAFPRWISRNADVVRFLDWLRRHNAQVAAHDRTGVYGLDVYNLHRSIGSLLRYLDRANPVAAQRARERYGCIDVAGRDSQTYGYAAVLGLSRAIEHDCVMHLVDACAAAAPPQLAGAAVETQFAAEQHLRTMRDAETYYRAMFGGSARWWNLRDAHMLLTLEGVLAHAVRTAGACRAVVWAHNAHIGDSRGCRNEAHGEVSFGQLARERFTARVRSLAFTSYAGSVTAAAGWNQPAVAMAMRPARRDSYEQLFHQVGAPCFAVDLRGAAADVLRLPRLERAIGAVYRPESERWSHYVEASLPLQFDAVVHCDESTAVEPLEPWSRLEVDVPESVGV